MPLQNLSSEEDRHIENDPTLSEIWDPPSCRIQSSFEFSSTFLIWNQMQIWMKANGWIVTAFFKIIWIENGGRHFIRNCIYTHLAARPSLAKKRYKDSMHRVMNSGKEVSYRQDFLHNNIKRNKCHKHSLHTQLCLKYFLFTKWFPQNFMSGKGAGSNFIWAKILDKTITIMQLRNLKRLDPQH